MDFKNSVVSLRWPKPIYLRVGYIILIALFGSEDFTDF